MRGCTSDCCKAKKKTTRVTNGVKNKTGQHEQFFSISIGLFRSIQYIENSDIVHTNICKTVLKPFLDGVEIVTYKTLH